MYLHMNEINYFVQCAKQRRNRNIYILRGHGSGVRSPQWLWLRAKADNRAMPSLLAEFFSACLKIFWKVKYVFVAPITFEHVYFLEPVPSVMSK